MSFEPCLLFLTDPRLFITDISPLTSWPLISKFWPVTPWPFAWWPLAPASLTDDVGHHDLWHQRSLTWPTFDFTDLSPYRPSTRDLWHYDHNYTIIFDLTNLRLLNLSFLTCEFRAMFIILDRSTPLHHWYFTFDFLAFDFQVLTCDPMTFCLMTLGTSIFDRWCWTPWPMTPRSLTWPTFDLTDLSPYRPFSTRDLWHYDHNYTIIIWPDSTDPSTDLNLYIFDLWVSSPCLLFWTDPRLFITDILPLTSWPFISKFWPVTPWPFAWWPLAPASCPMMLDTMTYDTKIFDLTDLSTWLTFHHTVFRPVTFDTTTIITP